MSISFAHLTPLLSSACWLGKRHATGVVRRSSIAFFCSNTSSPLKSLDPLSLEKYISDVRPMLKPPVANRMIFNEQLQVMVVGGPNQRKDFHINEGEEIFYQVEGDMELVVLERGALRSIVIPEGHMFVLPARVPHSPQRFAGTIGMVIERLRKKHEWDGLRYFVGNTKTVLYEEYFHCKDLGSELAPVINRFFASEAFRTNIPGAGMPVRDPPVKINSLVSIDSPPFNLSHFLFHLRESRSAVAGAAGTGPLLVSGALRSAEYNINVAWGGYKGVLQPARVGSASIQGESEIHGASFARRLLKKGDIHLVVSGEEISIEQCGENACIVAVTNNAFEQVEPAKQT